MRGFCFVQSSVHFELELLFKGLFQKYLPLVVQMDMLLLFWAIFSHVLAYYLQSMKIASINFK